MTAESVLIILAVVVGGIVGLYAAASLVRLGKALTEAPPFLSGHQPAEHALSRYHVRWYTITMIFLAFDMEMVFMYPWTLVVAEMGTDAVAEMFIFLGILMAGVVYAWREGALRWT